MKSVELRGPSDAFPAGDGEMAALFRKADWSASPVGPMDGWPQSLKTSVELMLAAPGQMALLWGPDYVALYNDAYAPTIGDKHPRALGRPGIEVWTELWDDLEPLVSGVRTTGEPVFAKDRPFYIERHGYGEEVFFDISYSAVRDESGGIGGVMCIVNETTERVRAESLLKDSEARFRIMADQAPVMMWVTDAHGQCTYLNRAWYDFTGQSEEEGEGVGWLAAVHPDDRGWSGEQFFAANAKGEAFRLEYRLCRKDGVYRWAIDAASPRFDPDGAFLGYIGSVIDIDERREMEDALRQSELRYRTLFESIESGFCVVEVDSDADGRIDYRVVEANPAFYEQTGFPETIFGKWLREAAPNLEEHWFERYGRIAMSGQAERFEQHSAMLGRWFDVYAFRTGQPEERRVAILFTNITRRRSVEEQLRASEQRYRTLFETIDEGFCIIEFLDGEHGPLSDYVHVEANSAYTVNAGIPDIVGKRLREIVSDSEADAWSEIYSAVLVSGEPIRFERELAETGRYLELAAFRIEPAERRQVAVLFKDITARRQAEERLRQINEELEERVATSLAERKLLADLVEGTDAFVQVADKDYRWLAINRAAADEFERIFGIRPKVGDSMLDLLADKPAHREQVRAVWTRALAGEQFTELGEFGDTARDRRHYEMKFNSLRNGEGELIAAYQFVHDVSERIREQRQFADAQEQLRQSQKMEAMGQLTGGVAHDFNNLLTPIVGALDMLQRKGVGGEREQRLIDGALQSSDRAKTLVQRLLAFARRQPLQSTAVDVAELVTGMADLLASTTGPQIRVVVEAAEGLPLAKADANQLEMALLNLGVNARDAMPDGGTLRISADAERIRAGHRSGLPTGHYVRLSVADTGVGMDDATVARAAEPFFSTKGVGKGTGLGLSMVHGLASQLGGALTIDSRPGVGTNVALWLPRTDDDAAPAVVGEEPARSRDPQGQVLLVDDEELVRASTADMLAELGYGVVEANSAEQALLLVSQGLDPDLLVTDHLMPGMSGTELARQMRQQKPEMPVLVVSGYTELEGIAADLPRLTKPFRNFDLAAKLAALGIGAAE